MTRMTRRTLLIAAAATAGGTAMAAAPVARPHATLAAFVRANAPAAAVSDAQMGDFVRRLLAQWRLDAVRRRLVLFLMERPAALRFAPAAVRAAQDRQERWVLTRFMLATDLFHDAPSPEPAYVAFPDPYELGCSNPLARFEPAASPLPAAPLPAAPATEATPSPASEGSAAGDTTSETLP